LPLDGQRLRSHGHARQARPSPSHNPGEFADRRQASSKTRPWQLARIQPRRKFRAEAGGGSSLSQTDPLRTSDDVYRILRRHLSAIYTQWGPTRPSSSAPTEAWGWLVGHPCRLPAAAGTGGYLQETSSSLAAVACLATTPLLAPLMPPLLLRFTARPYV